MWLTKPLRRSWETFLFGKKEKGSRERFSSFSFHFSFSKYGGAYGFAVNKKAPNCFGGRTRSKNSINWFERSSY
jgi:hypothetical protein